MGAATRPHHPAIPSVALGAIALILAAAAMLAVRRGLGGFSAPESAVPALVALFAGCACAWGIAAMTEAANRCLRYACGQGAIAAAAIAFHIPAAVAGHALLPAHPGAPLVAGSLITVASAYGAYRLLGGLPIADFVRRMRSQSAARAAIGAELPEAACEFDHDRELVQWLRRRSENGAEVVEGTFRVEFAPGQKQAALHVPLIPPLAAPPSVECCATDGALRVKVAAAYCYGVRIEARRGEPADGQLTALVSLVASAYAGGEPLAVEGPATASCA